jgi:hypothetical protein
MPALVLLLALALAADPAPRRTVSGDTITSDRLPAITLKVGKGFQYVGVFPFKIRDVAGGERHVWVDADARKRVRRLFVLQFEGYNAGSGYTYDYKPRNVIRLGAHDYNSNGFFYSDAEYAKEHPGNEAELTHRFLEDRGYTLDAEQLLYRFYRALPDDGNKSEFLIFYIEPMADLGLALKDASENQDSAREKALLAAARARALEAFTITKN